MLKLKALIRLNRWQVDEKSRALAALQSEERKIAENDAALVRQLEAEREAAASSIEVAASFGVYAQQLILQRRRLAAEQARLETRIEAARESLRLAMGETKKFEIADSNAAARARQEEAARESQELDEVALNGFRRREE